MNGTTLMLTSKLVSKASGFHYSSSKEMKNSSIKKFYPSPIALHANTAVRTGATPREKYEVFKSMEEWVGDNILTLMKPVEKCWQPQDFLPDPTSDDFREQVKELREKTRGIPDECLVVLVGDMITEEALPTYQSSLSMGLSDECYNHSSPWHIWTRAWSAEENRHGDLLNKYLFLSGRVDMKQIEKTIQYLIASGMKVGTKNNLYLGFIYTSFQERATFISHANTAKLAKLHGDHKLAQICGTIAADEKRHETAYTKIVDKLFELDPDETVISLAHIMRRGITMPAHLMYDGRDTNLFANYSSVASRLGVYTVMDYISILEHLVDKWEVAKLSGGLSGEGREAQDYVCGLASRLRRLEDRTHAKVCQAPAVSFSWIFGRDA